MFADKACSDDSLSNKLLIGILLPTLFRENSERHCSPKMTWVDVIAQNLQAKNGCIVLINRTMATDPIIRSTEVFSMLEITRNKKYVSH